VLVYSDDSRSYPSAVHLAGADRGTDTRSFVVEGDFLDSEQAWRLVRIQVVGPVYAADGSPLRASSIAVRPPQAPRAIAARQLEASSAECPEGQARIYFSDGVELKQASEADASGNQGPLASGLEIPDTARFQSNRVDICSNATLALELQAGIVVGSGAQENLAAKLDLERPR
jgi:hypothetical protein